MASMIFSGGGISGAKIGGGMIGDLLSNVSFYFGLRRILNGYNGYLCELRRDSDDDLEVFGFVGNELDVASITSWASGARIFIKTVYNQFDISENFVQATNHNQPELIISDSKWWMEFDGVDDYMENPNYVLNSSLDIYSVAFAIHTPTVIGNAAGILWSSGNNTTNNRNGAQHSSNQLRSGKRISGTDYGRTRSSTNSLFGVYSFENTANTLSDADIKIYKDLGQYDTGSNNIVPNSTNTFRISSTVGPLRARVFEVWLSMNLTNKTLLVPNIKGFYGL